MINNIDGLEELLESQKQLFSKTGEKRIKEEQSVRERNNFQRDYARIMYSNSFRRLQGKMQLMPVEMDKFNRNRLTHSLEVSQIARSITEKIEEIIKNKNIDIEITPYSKGNQYVVEAGALAHDIGNAPFGHHGEKVLNTLMRNNGGFEGNAQTFRILNEIEKKHPKYKGLNLTTRTLLSIVKYYKSYDRDIKKFLYKEDYRLLKCQINELGLSSVPRTIDVQIIDLADEIAYCAHDLEDALSQKYFSIDEFIYDLKIDSKNNDYPYKNLVKIFEEWVNKARKKANNASVYNSSEEYAFIFRKELTSIIVNELVNDIDILNVNELKEDFVEKTGTKRKQELAFKKWRLVRGVKACTFSGVNRSNDIQIYERLGTKVITGLFDALIDEEFNKDLILLPVEYRLNNEEDEVSKERKVADYIGGMMDTFAIETYEKIYGKTEISKLYNKEFYKKEKL